MIDEIVLVDTCNGTDDGNLSIGSAADSLALRFIEDALNYKEIKNISFFPETEIIIKDLREGSEPWDIMKRYREIFTPLLEKYTGKKILAGFSVKTPTQFKAYMLSTIFRETLNDPFIIYGGPACEREHMHNINGKILKDPVERMLEDGYADGVVIGRASPFMDISRLLMEGDVEGIKHVKGYYFMENGKVKGFGKGTEPKTKNIIPVSLRKNNTNNVLLTSIDDTCLNMCDFCRIKEHKKRPTAKQVISAIKQKKYKNYSKITFQDDNIHEEYKSVFYEEIFNTIDKGKNLFSDILHTMDDTTKKRILNPNGSQEIGSIFDGQLASLKQKGLSEEPARKFSFLDPAVLVERDFEKFFEYLIKHNFTSFFIGRDAVTERQSIAIGSNRAGKPKTQDELDSEKEQIKRLIRSYDLFAKYVGLRSMTNISLAYIFNPFETRESVLKTYMDINEMKSLGSEFVSIDTSLNILNPYPNTKIKEKYIDFMKDPENDRLYGCSINAWNEKAPAYKFLEILSDFRNHKRERDSNGDFIKDFKKMIWESFPPGELSGTNLENAKKYYKDMKSKIFLPLQFKQRKYAADATFNHIMKSDAYMPDPEAVEIYVKIFSKFGHPSLGRKMKKAALEAEKYFKDDPIVYERKTFGDLIGWKPKNT